MTGLSSHQIDLLLDKDESLLPSDLALLKERTAEIDPARLAVAEIAGRDSVAALLALAKKDAIDAAIPTAAYTGTEFGEWATLVETVETLRPRLAGEGVELVGDLQFLGSPKLWAALNGRYMRRLSNEFGFCSPCIGCHLYVHLVRVPLAWQLGAGSIVAGERESHDGRVKLNQTAAALDAYVGVIATAGLELALPIRGMAGGTQVEELIGDAWAEGDRQLGCVLSKNYVDGDGTVVFGEEDLDRFLERYIVPAGRAIVEAWRRQDVPEYEKVVGAAAFQGGQPA